MLKKMMLLAMAVGALVAFAVPATASATALEQGGKPLKPGAPIEATSTLMVGENGGGVVWCEPVTIQAELTKYEPGAAIITPKTMTWSNCTFKAANDGHSEKWTMTEVSPGKITLGGESGNMPLSLRENRYNQKEELYWSGILSGTLNFAYISGSSTLAGTLALKGLFGIENWTGEFHLTSKGAPVTVKG